MHINKTDETTIGKYSCDNDDLRAGITDCLGYGFASSVLGALSSTSFMAVKEVSGSTLYGAAASLTTTALAVCIGRNQRLALATAGVGLAIIQGMIAKKISNVGYPFIIVTSGVAGGLFGSLTGTLLNAISTPLHPPSNASETSEIDSILHL